MFRARAGSYLGEDRDQKLAEKTEAIVANASDYARYTAGVSVPEIAAPPTLERDEYIERRIRDAERYFRGRAGRFARYVTVFRAVTFLLGAGSTALATIAAVTSAQGSGESLNMGAWVAVLTTVSAALAAYVTASRYDFLINGYLVIAGRLEGLLNGWLAGKNKDDQGWTDFVQNVEDSLASHNQTWGAAMASPDN